MGSVVIVFVEPSRLGRCAGFVAEIGVGVGPFLGERAVEALNLPVGLGPVGACEDMADLAERGSEVAGSVAGSVVGLKRRRFSAAPIRVAALGCGPRSGLAQTRLVRRSRGSSEAYDCCTSQPSRRSRIRPRRACGTGLRGTRSCECIRLVEAVDALHERGYRGCQIVCVRGMAPSERKHTDSPWVWFRFLWEDGLCPVSFRRSSGSVRLG